MNRIWNRKHTLAACCLGLAMVLLSAGCDVTSRKKDQQIQALQARVAELQHRLDEKQAASRPSTPEQQGLDRMRSYRGKFEQRQGLDIRTHTKAKVAEVENAYQATVSNFGSPECIAAHQKFIKQYPGFNRAGCALSELAGMSEFTNPETVQYYQECIQKYNDCYWGDGVQVGPFARLELAECYKRTGQNARVEALYQEIKDQYPDAIDHGGQLLVDLIEKQ